MHRSLRYFALFERTNSLSASERSERDTYRGKNEKIGDVCLLASETVLGVDNAKSGICYIYVCMYGWYVCSLNARAGNFLQKRRLFRLDPSLF